MKNTLFFIVLLFVLQEPIFAQIFQDLNVQQCDSLIQANEVEADFVILDVRRSIEYDPEHLLGAINRNYYDADFEMQVDSLSKYKKYLIHCKSGGRSAKARDIMFDLGFEEVYNMLGGINSWKADTLPVTDAFAPLLMFVNDSIYEMETIAIGDIDTISITVTNRANALLIFNEICSIDNYEFSTDFDPDTTLMGAFDYQFNIFYEPIDEMSDTLSFCIDSEGGSEYVTIYRTGLDESTITFETGGERVSIYPNPASTFINIEGYKKGFDQLIIHNMQGRQFYAKQTHRNKSFDVSNFPSGQYIVTIEQNGSLENHLLLIAN